jgi:two-component sensor histidine kinase
MKSSKPAPVPRRWWGRNAGLRPRLVLIVGIAMLAPGVLAVLQAISSYRSSMRILEQNLAQAAQLAANEEENMISASREILTSLAAQPDIRGQQLPACRRALQRAIGGLDQYAGAAIVDANGAMVCTSAQMNGAVRLDDRAWFREIMSGDAFVVSDLIFSRWLSSWGMVTAVPLLDEQGTIQGSVALFIGLDWLTRRYQRAAPSDDTALALLDGKGDLITADASQKGVASGLPPDALIDEYLLSRTQTFTTRGRDGTWRLYAMSPLLGGRVFVIMGTPVLTAIGPLALQMAWGVATPILMWVLAIAVVWFGIEHLVVRWITYLERITSAYAAGRHSVRPERVSAAPAEIRSLGETFARMADLISAREIELRESLSQKEALVREVHHRVKNNLQLVMSLLNLHARRIKDPRAEAAFAEARSRINALATLHRRLYESETLQEVDLRWFLEDLCVELRRGGLSTGRQIDLTVSAADERIGPEVAVPLGLLVTECITNAYKHAFPQRFQGRIAVEVQRESPTTMVLSVSDDGVGYDPLAPVAPESSGLGRSLIDAFVRQLHGEMTVDSRNGTLVRVSFPLTAHVASTTSPTLAAAAPSASETPAA